MPVCFPAGPQERLSRMHAPSPSIDASTSQSVKSSLHEVYTYIHISFLILYICIYLYTHIIFYIYICSIYIYIYILCCIYKYYTCPAVTSNMHCISGSPLGAGHVDEGGPLQRRRPEQAEARQQLVVVVVVVRVSSNMV